MKNLFFIAALAICSLNAEAQMTLQGGGTTTLTFRKSPDFNDASISGSRYFTENFTPAKVNNGTQDFMIRYNAYSDVMEYKQGKETVELIKEQNKRFVFNDGITFELMNYSLEGKNYSQYHEILLDRNNTKISKYKSIKLIPAKKAANSYDSDTQATYKENKDVYFVTYDNQTVEFDGKSKTLEKLIPLKASEIKKFFKENKIKENDADMIKVGNFLSSL